MKIRWIIAAAFLAACSPEIKSETELRDITDEVALAAGSDPDAPPFSMHISDECAVNDIWCMGADGYPAPYDYDGNGYSAFVDAQYDPAGLCGWNEDAHGNFSPVVEGSRLVRGRCCDSPRAFRERMNIPLTACPEAVE